MTPSAEPRTYRAPSMPEALAKVQNDLGPEALVLATRRVLAAPPWQVWRDPEFEILALPAGSTADNALAPTPAPVPPTPWPEPVSRLHQQLRAQGMDETLAGQLLTGATEMLGPRALNDYRLVRDYVTRELAQRVTIGEHLPRKGEPCIVTLVGASGVGKTSAAAKLAAYAHYTLGRRTALISVDTFRIGALSQIQTYADILRLPLAIAYTPADLSAAIADHQDLDVIVIDTPGRNSRRPVELMELAALLAPLPAQHRTLLVGSATAKLNDLAETATAFRGLGLNGLLFSKMDETDTFGGLYSLASQTRLPASYFCFGPRVPEDIEPASAEKLVTLMLE